MTIITGPHVITSEDIGPPDEEDVVFEIKGDNIALGVASTSLHNRVFDIQHIGDVHDGTHNYHHIYTQDRSKILVSIGAQKFSSFKHTTAAEKMNQYSWWDIRHVSTSKTGKPIYKIKNKHTTRTLGDGLDALEFWTTSEFQSRVKRDRPQANATNHPRPTHSQPATSNLCGNPTCGIDFICAADYNRNVRPMGYPGV